MHLVNHEADLRIPNSHPHNQHSLRYNSSLFPVQGLGGEASQSDPKQYTVGAYMERNLFTGRTLS